MSTLDYCSHGRNLFKRPFEKCEKCDEIYNAVNALDYAKALVRVLDKQLADVIAKNEQPTTPSAQGQESEE